MRLEQWLEAPGLVHIANHLINVFLAAIFIVEQLKDKVIVTQNNDH